MIILYLTAHRPLRPRSLGDIEKAACAAFVCIPIRRVGQITTLSYRLELIVMPRPITTLGVAALLIQQRRRFFVEEDVCGEAALSIWTIGRAFTRIAESSPTVTSWFFPLPLASISNPAPINVQRPCTPLEHVLRHRCFRQRLA